MKYQGWFDKILLILKLQFAKLKPELLSLFPDTRSYSNKMSELVRSLRFQSLLQLPFVFPFLVFSSPLQPLAHKPTGCPKKMLVLSTYDFYLGRFLGVNFGNKKNIRLFSKILQKCRNFGVFMSFWPCQEWKTFSKCHKSQYFCICTYKYQIFWLFKWFFDFLKLTKS